MKSLGMEGYQEKINLILECADRFRQGIKKIKELELMGDSKLSGVAFRSVEPRLEVYSL